MKKYFFLAILAASSAAYADIDKKETLCYEKWKSVSAEPGLSEDYQALLKAWQHNSALCAGTTPYQANLAITNALLGDFKEANKALEGVKGKGSEYSYLIELARLQIYTQQLVTSGEANEKSLHDLEAKYFDFVKSYPERPEGFGLLGGLQTTIGKHQESIKNLEESLNKPESQSLQLYGVYRNLTISYSAVGEYQKSLSSANQAMSLKRGLTSDQYFMYAFAISDAGLGKIEEAKAALLLISAKKPEVKSDPDFIEAVNFVRAKIQRAGSK